MKVKGLLTWLGEKIEPREAKLPLGLPRIDASVDSVAELKDLVRG